MIFPHNFLFNPPIIAHRGASQVAPENTLAAFRKAKELGAKWLEFDVMLTADEEVIVIHDETLDRTTNGSGKVIEHTYQSIQTLDAGSWFSPDYTNEKIPTLRETLDLLQKLNLSANIEIKAQSTNEAVTAKKVVNLVQALPDNLSSILISSFSVSILEWVRFYSSTISIGFLMDGWRSDWQSICHNLNCMTINVNQKILTADSIKCLKAEPYLLLSYTVDEKSRAKKLFDLGVDAIFSNNLAELLSLYTL